MLTSPWSGKTEMSLELATMPITTAPQGHVQGTEKQKATQPV